MEKSKTIKLIGMQSWVLTFQYPCKIEYKSSIDGSFTYITTDNGGTITPHTERFIACNKCNGSNGFAIESSQEEIKKMIYDQMYGQSLEDLLNA